MNASGTVEHVNCETPFLTCSSSYKIIGPNRSSLWIKLLFPLTALVALIWYLARVLPEPSRASYPCQWVAGPAALSFVSGTSTSGGLPYRVCDGNLPSGQRSISHWFDASCFSVPCPGRLGNSGANIRESPGCDLQNLSIAETFGIAERLNFTFASAQNLLNHPNFGIPAANISSPGTLGTIRSLTWSSGYRIKELRCRLDF